MNRVVPTCRKSEVIVRTVKSYVIYSVDTRSAGLVWPPPIPRELPEQRFAVKLTYSFTPHLEPVRANNVAIRWRNYEKAPNETSK
jgi:hypothetical protein